MPLSIKQLLEPKPTPNQGKLKSFLDSDKSGSAYTLSELQDKLGISVINLISHGEGREMFAPYCFIHRRAKYIANPAVVKEYQRAVKA